MSKELVLPPVTLEDGVRAYCHLHLSRMAPSYHSWGQRRLAGLVGCLGGDMCLADVRLYHLDLWLAGLINRQVLYADHQYRQPVRRRLSPSTIDGYVRICRSLFNWLVSREWLDRSPAGDLKAPPIPDCPPDTATREEVRGLLSACKGQLRNRTAIRLLAVSGIRASELVSLNVGDVFLSERYVIVRGKGRGGQNKYRPVPFDSEQAGLLSLYLDGWDSGPVFLSDRGGRWSYGGLYQMMRRASERAGLSRYVSPHMLRHFFGVTSASKGLHIRAIQQILGHAQVTTTERYTRFAPARLIAAYDKTFTEPVV